MSIGWGFQRVGRENGGLSVQQAAHHLLICSNVRLIYTLESQCACTMTEVGDKVAQVMRNVEIFVQELRQGDALAIWA